MFESKIFLSLSSLVLMWGCSVMPTMASSVIDLHLHAGPSSSASRWYSTELNETADEAQTRYLLDTLNAHSIVRGVIGGPPADVERIRSADPSRLIGSVAFPCSDGVDPNLFPCFKDGGDWPDLDWLSKEVDAGRIGAIGELYNVYAGVAPNDPRMWPYYALAAKHDLLVLVHADAGPPPEGRVEGCCADFDERLARPALYEPILTRYPQLRLVLYHVFRPDFVQEALMLLDKFPNVMVETSPMTLVPTPLVHSAINTFVEAGHEDRIVFGSDYWGAISGSLEVIESAHFLSEKQKRAILYDNAARLLSMDKN
ncbi:amidohydrolase family protein [Aliiglaciecola sp. 3_MG-2023]|uniref:amidohydrolase family protein n=1 Tax=Aliiglaciecola sp. 3_MG-2023 TaxID=3062644 RepID=UPI0026E22388|nr:amidohydrolase family protein [Aliiglaciecola sp. 3_MG-2023]MDO6694262.1 amidohydrolase family protein [Aliiglaciecola sp. 3_MG-2023]